MARAIYVFGLIINKKTQMSIILSKKMLAQAYGISSGTLRKWLKNAGVNNRCKLLRAADRVRLFELYGNPFVNGK